jgi:hypothetical protein
MKPFCDWLGVTVPEGDWDALRLDLLGDLDAIGMHVEVDVPGQVLWRSGSTSATVKATKRHRVWALGCSGAACSGLRAAGRFNSYLAAIGTRPHRVTRLDASLDLPVDAAPIVAGIATAGRAGELSLTRKKINPVDVTTVLAARDSDGAITGTVYCGPRRADARMVVYDKQAERLSRKLTDTGPLTRYELRFGARTGVTLRDASDPELVFWHYASPDFLPRPVGMAEWSSVGTGFELTRMEPLLPYQRLLRRIEASGELVALVAAAESCGPRGLDFLVSRIRRLSGGAGVSPAGTLSMPGPGVSDVPTEPDSFPAACHPC